MNSAPKRQEYAVDGMHAPLSHYTDAVRHGDIVYLSGCGPLDENLNLVGSDDIVEQARRTLENLQLVLTAVGATFADVLKVNVYLTDISDLKLINPVRQEFFGSAKPASTAVQVVRLAVPGMKIEIEAVAGLPSV